MTLKKNLAWLASVILVFLAITLTVIAMFLTIDTLYGIRDATIIVVLLIVFALALSRIVDWLDGAT